MHLKLSVRSPACRTYLIAGLTIIASLLGSLTRAQESQITAYRGTLDTGSAKMRLQIEWQAHAAGPQTGTLISLDQGASRFAMDPLEFNGDSIRFEIKPIGAQFQGQFVADRAEIQGNFVQGGRSTPLNLKLATDDSRYRLVQTWLGILKAGNIDLKLQFRILKSQQEPPIVVMDSLTEKKMGIPAQGTFTETGMAFDIPMLGAKYTGSFSSVQKSLLDGKWSQGGQDVPLQLSSENVSAPVAQTRPIRPQTPTPPFPYSSQEVEFTNRNANVTLAATLTVPEGHGPFPAVVLINGSGPHDRDVSILGHKHFTVLADHLTRNGTVVLRYDERGVGKSTGNYALATSVDLAADAAAGVELLKTIATVDAKKIGILGHSEGGSIAPMVASQRTDIAWLVLLAGPAVPGKEILLDQIRLIAQASGAKPADLDVSISLSKALYEAIDTTSPQSELRTKLERVLSDYVAGLPEETRKDAPDLEVIRKNLSVLGSPWYRFFVVYDPADALTKIQCPVLGLFGEKDLQVSAALNGPALRSALKKAGNNQVTIQVLPDLNHLFQTCTTGTPDEYAEISETFSPAALELISAWIRQQCQ